MSVLALIPARAGSKGIPGKNLRKLDGKTLIQRAIMCAVQAEVWPVYVTTDIPQEDWQRDEIEAYHIPRPPELATDTAAMIDVVRHALAKIPGPSDQIICLLQPTAVFRTPAHVQQAIQLLQATQADSVVSVVTVPPQHVDLLWVSGSRLARIGNSPYTSYWHFENRQTLAPVYIRDGTVYAFWRKTVDQHGTIYGEDCRALIIPPEESCELDTEADWDRVWERYWRQKLLRLGLVLEKCHTCGMATWVDPANPCHPGRVRDPLT